MDCTADRGRSTPRTDKLAAQCTTIVTKGRIMWLVYGLLMVLPFSQFVEQTRADRIKGTYEKARYDGRYNNLAHPDWGSVDSHLTSKVPATYADFVYMMGGVNRPNARKLSELFMKGPDELGSVMNRTALFSFFGQMVSLEILMARESGCPIEMHKIDIEKCDEMYDAECTGKKFMPFHRAWYDQKTGQSPKSPREQIVKKPLPQETSTKKPLIDHSRSHWLPGTGILTSVIMSGGFFVILFWLLGQKASKKPH